MTSRPASFLSQDNVQRDPINGPWPIGQYVYMGSNRTIQSDVAQFYGDRDVSGTFYYALVTLSSFRYTHGRVPDYKGHQG